MSENRLKKAREAAGMSVRRAAEALGMGTTKLQKIEDNPHFVRNYGHFDPQDLSVRELEAMAALYGVAPAVLLGRAPFPDRPALTAAAS